jgi:hypothetical protein
MQEDAIRIAAERMVYEDIQQNTDYLWQVVQTYVHDRGSPQEQAKLISSDPDIVRLILGFDPETGESCLPKEPYPVE